MLSEDKQVVLQEKVSAWGAANKVPAKIQELVVAVGVNDPKTTDDLHKICMDNLWSEAVIDWYFKFITYLDEEKKKDAPQQVSENESKTRQLIEAAIDALQQALEAMNG